MNIFKKTRTRFAPSPSGIMHIGNVRSALINFLCAKENDGDFILRIEDTDQTRTDNYFLLAIYDLLDILELFPDESPLRGGSFGPYIQSERFTIYEKYLKNFLEKGLIYRCFKTTEELDEERKKQIALKMPPRYQRKVLSKEEENILISSGKPFVWRLYINNGYVNIEDKIKGFMTFDLSNFADCPLTRQDGSFTFLFANFVDDIEMQISYVIRGEEHLSNTAIQGYMYDIIGVKKPYYYHLPLICDKNKKKLSKRNFGFNIFDLLEDGFLPQAIINYMGIIGSNNMKEEILSLNEMVQKKLFCSMRSSGLITYDINKLLWINSKWMQQISVRDFKKCLLILKEKTKNFKDIEIPSDENFIVSIKKESRTIKEFVLNINMIYHHNYISINFDFEKKNIVELCCHILKSYMSDEGNKGLKLHILKLNNFSISDKVIYQIIRKILINQEEGVSVLVLLQYISFDQINKNINKIVFQ